MAENVTAAAILSRAEAVSQVKNVQKMSEKCSFGQATFCLAVVLVVFLIADIIQKHKDRRNRLH